MLNKKYKTYIVIIITIIFFIASYLYMINKKNLAFANQKEYYKLYSLIQQALRYKQKNRNIKLDFCAISNNKITCKKLNKSQWITVQNKIFNSNIYIKSFDIKSNKKLVDVILELK